MFWRVCTEKCRDTMKMAVVSSRQVVSTQTVAESKPPLVLAIDVGSSLVKAVLYDTRARIVEGTDAMVLRSCHSKPWVSVLGWTLFPRSLATPTV